MQHPQLPKINSYTFEIKLKNLKDFQIKARGKYLCDEVIANQDTVGLHAQWIQCRKETKSAQILSLLKFFAC